MTPRARSSVAVLLAGWVLALHATEPATLRDFDAKSLATIRAANAGRPFVLALWSVHCEPCRNEMAQWAALQRRNRNIRIHLVATDPQAERPLLRQFLAGHNLEGVQTWAFADDFEERVRYAIDPAWRGELPRTYLFDAKHRPEARSGPADLSWIEPWMARQPSGRPASGPAR